MVIYSTLSGNQGDGGAIENSGGTVTVTDSTISGNTGEQDGGGIFNNSGAVAVTDSTFSANTAYYGGAIYNNGTLSATNSTISGNAANDVGGGIDAQSSVTLANTIVAGDTCSGSPDVSGPVTANYSLIQSTTGATISGSNNLLNQGAGLGSLGNYGGPTQTIPLLPGSPAIGTGSVALAVGPNGQALTTDQRGPGYPSTVGGSIDLGAVEVRDTMTTLVSSLNPSVYGQTVTFTATVIPVWEPGTVGPTGTVTFYDNGAAIGTETLAVVGGIDEATLTTSALPGDTNPITAAYTSGDANFAPRPPRPPSARWSTRPARRRHWWPRRQIPRCTARR